MENYDHIELSQEEQEEALRLARKAKHHKIENEKYRERISRPIEYPVFNCDQLASFAYKRLLEMQPQFEINDFNRQILHLLSLYFSCDERFEETNGYSLQKGIMLVGPIGCGKTTIMKAFALNTHNPYSVISTRYVSDDYSKVGVDALDRYSDLLPGYPQQNFGHRELGICFDDLGTESSRKHFGNESNVMHDIILSRYDNHILKGKTHFTANLTGDEIEELYSTRARSRLREMCNFITFDPQSADYRK